MFSSGEQVATSAEDIQQLSSCRQNETISVIVINSDHDGLQSNFQAAAEDITLMLELAEKIRRLIVLYYRSNSIILFI